MTLTLADLDATDRRVVEGLGTIELHHAVRVVLPSGTEVTAEEIRELCCQHRRLRERFEDVFECCDCDWIERA